jgi:hypothetical protein
MQKERTCLGATKKITPTSGYHQTGVGSFDPLFEDRGRAYVPGHDDHQLEISDC